MSNTHEGNLKPSSIEQEEHLVVNGTPVKRVLVSGFDGSSLQDLTVDANGHLQVDVLTGGGAVTNAGTFVVQENGSALTALQVIDNFISGSKGLVTEDNSGSIKTSVELIDNIVNSINGSAAVTVDSYTHLLISCASQANKLLVSSAANKQIWVYGLGFTASAAGTVAFQDEDDLPITGLMNIDANGGMVVSPSGNYAMPIWKLATDKDLEMDVVTASIQGWLDYAILSV
jgi:hypothetical protein